MVRLWDKDWNCTAAWMDEDELQMLWTVLFYLAVILGA